MGTVTSCNAICNKVCIFESQTELKEEEMKRSNNPQLESPPPEIVQSHIAQSIIPQGSIIQSSLGHSDINSKEALKFSTLQTNSFDLSQVSEVEISKLIFDKINDIRFRPEEYLQEATKRGLSKPFQTTIDHINQTSMRPDMFIWSDKKYNLLKANDINGICKDKYKHDAFFVKFKPNNISMVSSDEIVWQLIESYDNDDRLKIIKKEYSHCVISAVLIQNGLDVHFVFLYKD